MAYVLGFMLVITSSDSNLEPRPLVKFAGMSVLLFGGVYVLIPLMQEVVVATLGRVNEKHFIDAIAIGPLTQGPILISETFIGHDVLGVAGAVMATLDIFVPPAIFLVTCAYYLEKMQSSKHIMAALMGIRSAVVGMIAAALVAVQTAEQNYIYLAIFSVSLILLIRFEREVAWIIPVAGLVGYLLC